MTVRMGAVPRVFFLFGFFFASSRDLCRGCQSWFSNKQLGVVIPVKSYSVSLPFFFGRGRGGERIAKLFPSSAALSLEAVI